MIRHLVLILKLGQVLCFVFAFFFFFFLLCHFILHSWFVTDSEVSTQEKVRTTASGSLWIKTTVSGAPASSAT